MQQRGFIEPSSGSAIGARYHIDGQVFEAIRRSDTGHLVWQAPCASCGQAFTISSNNIAAMSAPNRRCALHHKPGRKVRTIKETANADR